MYIQNYYNENTTMRHVIAHLIRGEPKKKHEAITRDLVKKFDAFPIHERIVPHLTLKRWFEPNAECLQNLYATLDAFVATQKQSTFKFGGLGHFGEDVIYVDVVPSPEMSRATHSLMSVLHTVKGMTFDEFDAIEDDFHATLVMRALKPFHYAQIWDYLNAQDLISFDIKFDNIAIMKRETDKWVVDRIWELPR